LAHLGGPSDGNPRTGVAKMGLTDEGVLVPLRVRLAIGEEDCYANFVGCELCGAWRSGSDVSEGWCNQCEEPTFGEWCTPTGESRPDGSLVIQREVANGTPSVIGSYAPGSWISFRAD